MALSDFTGVPDPDGAGDEAARFRQNALNVYAAAGARADLGLWGLAFTESPGLLAVAANRRRLQPMRLRVHTRRPKQKGTRLEHYAARGSCLAARSLRNKGLFF